MISRKHLLALSFVLICLCRILEGGEEPSIHGKIKADPIFQDSEGLAIRGYDPVAYFKEGKAIKGKKEFEHRYLNANWHFVTEANKDLFVKNPDKYLPQYGGYCAYGMSHGYAAPIDPQAWTIVRGKLYLNYNREVKDEWSQDIPGHIRKANQNWPKIPKKVE